VKRISCGPSLALIMLMTAPWTAEAQSPRIQRVGRDHVLQLPPAMRATIEAAAPGFQSWKFADYHPDVRQYYTFTMRQAPWAAIGDFNGDGTEDVVIDGYTATKELRVAVLSHPKKAQVLILDSLSRAPKVYPRSVVLQFVAPGKVGTNFDEETKLIFADAFNVYYWEKAGSMYYWEDGQIKEFVTSD
jgi:hypothetical protein